MAGGMAVLLGCCLWVPWPCTGLGRGFDFDGWAGRVGRALDRLGQHMGVWLVALVLLLLWQVGRALFR
ncbi:hypothetical protein SAMN05878503_10341 [Cereibacter ovatus]|uniref:Uncharacterized protein n=1 Tax=Cereibacter ovatus TaxID=439529 RepID=A0A285CPS1_9RHOB|nr:hypothetical protein [Cereibacter ovatus]SNX69056.1 hypothetical protein SAMN05878503_10341 [Cereibacter ovatus]